VSLKKYVTCIKNIENVLKLLYNILKIGIKHVQHVLIHISISTHASTRKHTRVHTCTRMHTIRTYTCIHTIIRTRRSTGTGTGTVYKIITRTVTSSREMCNVNLSSSFSSWM
jgi:hypothetical protein